MLPALLGYFPHPRGGNTGWAGTRPGAAGLSQLPWPQHAGERPHSGLGWVLGLRSRRLPWVVSRCDPRSLPGAARSRGPTAPLPAVREAGSGGQPGLNRGEGTTAPGPPQSLHSLWMCWSYPPWSGRSVPQDHSTGTLALSRMLVPVPASGTPGRKQRGLRRAIFSRRQTGSAAAA